MSSGLISAIGFPSTIFGAKTQEPSHSQEQKTQVACIIDYIVDHCTLEMEIHTTYLCNFLMSITLLISQLLSFADLVHLFIFP